MLREMKSRQGKGEPPRRWFTSPNIDLFVWVDDHGAPTGFQLCYDRQFREHALTWTSEHGFSHMAVDGGESRPGRHKGAPILVADGTFEAERVLQEFLAESKELPPAFVEMIESRVRALAAKGDPA